MSHEHIARHAIQTLKTYAAAEEVDTNLADDLAQALYDLIVAIAVGNSIITRELMLYHDFLNDTEEN